VAKAFKKKMKTKQESRQSYRKEKSENGAKRVYEGGEPGHPLSIDLSRGLKSGGQNQARIP